jgi:hypothetical protein
MWMHPDYVYAGSECELVMPVRLDQLRAHAQRPALPDLKLWLAMLALLLACGSGVAVLLESRQSSPEPLWFWGAALWAPVLIWCALGFLRMVVFVSQQSVAEGWNGAREQDLIQMTLRGRRSHPVLAVSLHTALRESAAPAEKQLDALLDGQIALNAQALWSGAIARHSQLPRDTSDSAESVLAQVLKRVLADLAPTLSGLPTDRPVALSLSITAALPDEALRRIWADALTASGIGQSLTPVEGTGLPVVDARLDERADDQSLLMVVAVQLSPQQSIGEAESAIGLLLGHCTTQNAVLAIACLHRPEQECEPSLERLLYALRQAMDWVPLAADSIERIWQAGVDTQRQGDIASTLGEVPISSIQNTKLCDLDQLLGHPGDVAPWLAIAAATLAVQRSELPQLVLSGGGSVDAGIWCTVLTHRVPLHRKET